MAKRIFFCERCRQARDWPGLRPTVYGPCMECGAYDNLYEVTRADLVPFEPSALDYLFIEQVRRHLAMLPSWVMPQIACKNVRIAWWVKRELADLSDRIQITVG